MGRFVIMFALAGLMITAPTLALAKGGGTLHLFGPFSTEAQAAERANFHAIAPTLSKPSDDFVVGCGRGRYHDPDTHRCRGPADLGN